MLMQARPGRMSRPFAFARAGRSIVPVTFRTWHAGLGVQVPPAALNLFPPGPTNTHGAHAPRLPLASVSQARPDGSPSGRVRFWVHAHSLFSHIRPLGVWTALMKPL